MTETVLALFGDPAFSLATAAIATGVTAAALIAIPFILLALRHRLDTIDAAQAETAAFFASESKRLATMIAHQRAETIGDAMRRSSSANAASANATLSASEQRPTNRRAAGDPANALHQPLRKTIH